MMAKWEDYKLISSHFNVGFCDVLKLLIDYLLPLHYYTNTFFT